MILVALGSNLPSIHGDSEETIVEALKYLNNRGLYIHKVSKIYTTAPVPVSDQPWFKNAVVSIKTKIDPYAVLRILQDIEVEFGAKPLERNGPRVLDLDLLSYQMRIISDAYISLPHVRMHQRSFVLYPLMDIDPDWVHPLLNKTVRQLIDELAPADQIIEPISTVAA